MDFVLTNADIFVEGSFRKQDILVREGIIADIAPSASVSEYGVETFNLENCFIFPGFADVHVHLREPGFSYKETIKTGTAAAASSGYTAVCSMPNLNPVPDSVENLNKQLEIIKKDACINVYPYGSVTVGEMGKELSDFDGLAGSVIGFSDDGRGVQNDDMMLSAMKKAKKLDKIIAAHCEVNELLQGGYIHKGEYARAHGHKGICSESEWKQIERDIKLAELTGCKYHVCHISTAESVELIRQAKARGVDITCETAPHYLILCDENLKDEGRFKMNPPLRSEKDRQALIEGIKDGTIDMIATDHAPHSTEEKGRGLSGSLMGICGLETAFPLMYTYLVKPGIISLEKLIELMNVNPRKRFGIGGEIKVGNFADFTVFDLNREYEINPDNFRSLGRATPFEGWKVYGKCLLTVCNGMGIWRNIV